MNPDRFQRVMRAFDEAVALPTSERADYLHRALADDSEARAEVEELLRHHEGDQSPVATAAGLEAVGRPASWSDVDRSGGAAPVLKGDYRILRTIGEGGMGVVFEAEQAFPRRRVALKAVRPGMASRGMLRRFRNEVQLLARLQHPGIAQIYEAGLADEHAVDQAFFAMELIDGLPITRYAAARQLGHRARWELLLKVCDAVQHAHQRGVIHRDLKPANILVAADGQPKVVDFGVARAAESNLDDGSLATRIGQVIGTPSYMSPEQMRGEIVDTRSDVYALGVVSYELLSGRLPFDLANLPITEAARIVRDDDPPTLGSLERELRGDAEIIVAKAMAKEPERRYSTAADMAEDIRRFLAGEPIDARRDSAAYILRKQLRRYRTAAVAAAVAILGLMAFAAYAVVAAQKQRELAVAAQAASADAVRARDAALTAKAAADAATERALAELKQAAIERGRLEAIADNVPLSEELLWRAHLENPESTSAKWGLWELYNRHPTLWTRAGPARAVRVATSPDARLIAFGLNGGRVAVLDTRTGDEVATITELGENPTSLAFNADASRLAVGLDKGGLSIIELPGGLEHMRLDAALTRVAGAVRAAAWSSNGAELVTAHSDKTVRFWDSTSGQFLRQWAPYPLPVAGLIFSPNGQQLAIFSDATLTSGSSLGVWSVDDGACVRDLTGLHDNQVSAIAFSADGRVLYTGGREGLAFATSLDSNLREPIPISNAGSVLAIAVSPTGRELFVASADQATIFDCSSSVVPIRKLARQRFAYQAAAWLNEHELTIVTTDGLIRRLDTGSDPSATRFADHTSWCFSVAYSPDGRLMAVGDSLGSIEIFETATHRKLGVCSTEGQRIRTRGLKFLSDSRTLLAGSQDGVIRIFDAIEARLVHALTSVKAEIYALNVDPAGKLVATGHIDGSTRIWNIETREKMVELPRFEKRLEGLAFSPDGKQLALSALNTGVVLFDVESRTPSQRLKTSAMPWNVVYSPDGRTLYISTQDGTVDLFDMPAGTHRTTLQGHRRLVPGLALSPDGRLLASSGEEGIIKLWDTQTLVNLLTLDPQAGTVVCLAFSPDSSRLAGSAAARLAIEYDFAAGQRFIKGNFPYQQGRLSGVSRR